MISNEQLRNKNRLLHLAINFDIRDDILAITNELSGYGGGYGETIGLAEKKMGEDPEGVLEMLQSTIEIARMAENPESLIDKD